LHEPFDQANGHADTVLGADSLAECTGTLRHGAIVHGLVNGVGQFIGGEPLAQYALWPNPQFVQTPGSKRLIGCEGDDDGGNSGA
jgi:hypothetical protein